MNRSVLGILGAALLLGLGSVSLGAEAANVSTCVSDPVTGSLFATRIKVFLLREDAASLARLGLVPVDTSQVSLVDEPTVCDAALQAYNAKMSQYGVAAVAEVYVVRAGPERYAVLNTANGAGEFTYYLIFDSTWAFVKEFAG